MNADSSEKHLKEIERILKDLVERWDELGEQERNDLRASAKKELGHIEGLITFVHKSENN